MDEADLGDAVDDLLILDDEVEVQRLGKNRMLRSKGDDGCFAHASLFPSQRPSERAPPSPPWRREPSPPSRDPCLRASPREPRLFFRPARARRAQPPSAAAFLAFAAIAAFTRATFSDPFRELLGHGLIGARQHATALLGGFRLGMPRQVLRVGRVGKRRLRLLGGFRLGDLTRFRAWPAARER